MSAPVPFFPKYSPEWHAYQARTEPSVERLRSGYARCAADLGEAHAFIQEICFEGEERHQVLLDFDTYGRGA